MLVNIHEITEDGLDFEVHRPDFVVEQAGEQLPFRQVRGNFHLERVGDQIQISGEVSADLTTHCSRCSKEFTLSVKERFDFRGIPAHLLKLPETQELSSDELEVTFLQGDEIDLEEIIRENIYLSMPIRPLCSESCRGLCSRCGNDLNESDCACEEARIDPRFQPLGILRQKIAPKAH